MPKDSKKRIEIIFQKCKELNIKIHSIETESKRRYVYYSMPNTEEILKKRLDHFVDEFKIIPIQPYNKSSKSFYNDERIRKDIKILGEYTGWNQAVKSQCKICGNVWFPSANKLLLGQGCPICSQKRIAQKFRKTNNQFLEDLKNKNLAIVNIEPYKGAHATIKFKCLKCGNTWKATPDRILREGSGCIACGASQGERLIANTLRKMNIDFETQKTFEDCVNIGKLRFDFYLPKYNICIEYQGEQHYKPICFSKKEYGKEIENFKSLQERDKIKRKFCKNKKIKLIEISFKDISLINPDYLKKLLF